MVKASYEDNKAAIRKTGIATLDGEKVIASF